MSDISPFEPDLFEATDFSTHPKSITEHKADKTENSATWTPRDAVIAFLRRMDAGEFPNMKTVVIMGTWHPKDTRNTTHTYYSVASPTLQDTLGCIELGRLKMYADGNGSDGK